MSLLLFDRTEQRDKARDSLRAISLRADSVRMPRIRLKPERTASVLLCRSRNLPTRKLLSRLRRLLQDSQPSKLRMLPSKERKSVMLCTSTCTSRKVWKRQKARCSR